MSRITIDTFVIDKKLLHIDHKLRNEATVFLDNFATILKHWFPDQTEVTLPRGMIFKYTADSFTFYRNERAIYGSYNRTPDDVLLLMRILCGGWLTEFEEFIEKRIREMMGYIKVLDEFSRLDDDDDNYIPDTRTLQET